MKLFFQPYTLRCGIIEAAKNLITSVYSENDLNDNQKGERDMIFEILESHLIDLNAYCRCRVWPRLFLKGCYQYLLIFRRSKHGPAWLNPRFPL